MTGHDLDVATLLLRLALGPMLLAHGWNKLFGAGGIAGTTRWFEALGLRPAAVHARVAAISEISAGVLMTLGLFSALTAAAFIGLMLVATLTDHRGKGYFVFKGGAEYTVLVAMVALGYALLGPGRWSLDEVLGLDLAGARWALIAVGLGVVASVGLLVTSYRPVSPHPKES